MVVTPQTVRLADGREVEIGVPIEGGRYNAYACDRGHHNLTLDLDEGTTPMFLTCRRTDGCGDPGCWCGLMPGEECGERSVSAGYPNRAVPEHLFPVQVVWRRATQGQLKRERREGGDYYRSGGLHPEWTHPQGVPDDAR